jgi:hypothetical protein
MKRVAAALSVLVVLTAVAVAQGPPPGGPGGTPPGNPPQGGMPPGRGPGGPGGMPPFPGDSTAAERDSLMHEVLKSIVGKEKMPAESVFKDIKIFKGRPAGNIPLVMNYGFGRSIGTSCYHCHARNGWDKDEKKQKGIAREMFKMVMAINDEHLAKIEGLGEPGQDPNSVGGPVRPTVNCSTCHRGSIHTNPDFGRRGGGLRPAGGPGAPGGGGR